MKKIISTMLVVFMVSMLLVGCGSSKGPDGEVADGDTVEKPVSGERQEISLWFWGAPPHHQETMQRVLADKYNASQDEYELKIEFRNTVDKDISVALSANKGPDIVYGSGPAFVAPLAEAGKLESMEGYSEQYGWKDRLLEPVYEASTVKGELYSVPNSLNTIGIFYNKKTLEENGWDAPTTIDDLVAIMDEAIEKGMYASVTGNKGWKPVNDNYTSLFLTHFAGPEIVYDCLMGEEKWNNPEIVAALEELNDWFNKGYLAGDDYINLNFNESVQLLADGRSPFFFGPTLVFQFASEFFTGDKEDDLGFIAFPSGNDKVAYPSYTLGTTASLSINANSEHKDEAAKIIDDILTVEFMQDMTKEWPGYWGVPLVDLATLDTSDMTGLSLTYTEAIKETVDAIEGGNFGYYGAVFFPPATDNLFIDVETVWYGESTVEELLDKIDIEFKREKEKGLVPPIPKPAQ